MLQATLGLYSDVIARFKQLRKVDLHRHLSGSVRPSSLLELAQDARIALPVASAAELQELVSVRSPVRSLDEFICPRSGKALRPWQILPQLLTSPEVASRIAFEAMEDAASDGVEYVELRTSPHGALDNSPVSLEEFLGGLKSGLARAARQFQVTGVVVLSLIRHTLVSLPPAERTSYYARVLSAAERFRGNPVAGFDLAGTEQAAPPRLFEDFFGEAKRRGFAITIHAGEGEHPKQIRDAISILGADRIGHGVTLPHDPELIQIVKSKGIIIEQCITSNVMTRVIRNFHSHPLPRLLNEGIKVVLCSDDPTVLDVSLTDEYERAHVFLGISEAQLKEMNQWALQARFTGLDAHSTGVLSR